MAKQPAWNLRVQCSLHALLNQQFRVGARVLVHVVRHTANDRGTFLHPLTIGHARNVRIRQIH